MRTLQFCLLMLTGTTLLAQNWVVLNPAYRYNYKTDDSDTIRSQIRVMDIDTLGPDSFRYELNRVASLCTSCPYECMITVDLPQFLQADAQIRGSIWRFSMPDTLVIHSLADVDSTWIFNEQDSIPATVVGLFPTSVLGVSDTVRVMVSTMNDTIIWSREHGIVMWHMLGEPRYDLVGVQGAGQGIVMPSFEEIYAFQPGDALQFNQSWSTSMHVYSSSTLFLVDDRTESQDTVFLSGESYHRFNPPSGSIFSYNPTAATSFIASSNVLKPLDSWPGQLVDFPNWGPNGEDMAIVPKHYLDNTGTYVIEGGRIGSFGMFAIYPGTNNDCLGVGFPGPYLNYVIRSSGFYYYQMSTSYSEYNSFSFRGAVINGDTLGSMDDEYYFHVGLPEFERPKWWVYPNPVSSVLHIEGDLFNMDVLQVFDATGERVKSWRMEQTDRFSTDVSDLPPGLYVLSSLLDGHVQRFVVAR